MSRGSKHDLNREQWEIRRHEFVARGNELPQTKLTADQVKAARARYRRFSKTDGAPAIARSLGVHVRTVEKFLRRETWGTV
jgi:hypothetical protein